MDEAARRTKVEWRPWGEAAFAEARSAGKPVLLSLAARWCTWCREMDETTYADPRVAANVEETVVPVRVDVDRQPRVRERYNVGGFPSTVFCTPTGAMLTGATTLDPAAMRQVLDRVRETYDRRGDDAGRVPRALRQDAPPAGPLTERVERLLAGQLDETFDARAGGWGIDAKFPLPETCEFALKRAPAQARRSLDAVREHLFDAAAGGFFRYATTRVWGDVQREKLTDENAALLRAFANAYLYTGDPGYRDPAAGTLDYLTTTLWNDALGAFAGSQAAPGDDAPDADAVERAPVDGTAFADRNGLAADALLTYHAYTDDERARRYATDALDYLSTALLDGGTVAHYDDPASESGLLADHAAALRGFATAAAVLGPDYLPVARAVADDAVDRLRTESGAFLDGPREGVGLLDRPLFSLDENALLADALVDLAALTDESRYRAIARDAVAAFAGAADRVGVQAARYGRAAARLVSPPLCVLVATDPGTALHRAALRVADHEKVVVPVARRVDESLEAGAAYVRTADGERSSPARTPDDLLSLVATHAEG